MDIIQPWLSIRYSWNYLVGVAVLLSGVYGKFRVHYLDGPIQTFVRLDIPIPVSGESEATAVPNVEAVKEVILKAGKRWLQ